jgi:hypothetical protein
MPSAVCLKFMRDMSVAKALLVATPQVGHF